MKKLIFMMLALTVLLCACAKKAPAAAVNSSPSASPSAALTPSPSPSVTPTPVPTPQFTNPLTGLETATDISKLRPFAVMLNNIEDALPQYGQSQADIIYEVLAEGGITRMVAVYQDISSVTGEIGSVRSTRPYFLDIAQGLDAVLLHCGGSTEAYELIASRHIDDVDGIFNYSLYYRNKTRIAAGYSSEHTLFTADDYIKKFLATDTSINKNHESGYACNMKFGTSSSASGTAASKLTVVFSYYKDTVFDYNAEDQRYYVSEFDDDYTDGNTGKQVSVKNVLVLYADCENTGDSYNHIDVSLVGSGKGLYLCNGKAVDITWSKDGNDAQFVYKLANGQPLVFAPGNTYINIPKTGSEVTVK